MISMFRRGIFHDPEVYAQPDDFIPERFLDSAGNLDVQGRDPSDVAFGFGRREDVPARHRALACTNRSFVDRVCPGRHFAESTSFIMCASVLSAFEIGPPVGEDGTPLPVKREASDHLVVS